jgi:hypothetical protein
MNPYTACGRQPGRDLSPVMRRLLQLANRCRRAEEPPGYEVEDSARLRATHGMSHKPSVSGCQRHRAPPRRGRPDGREDPGPSSAIRVLEPGGALVTLAR